MSIPRPSLREHLRLARMLGDIGGQTDLIHERWGPIVDVGFRIPVRAVYAFGPEANRAILADSTDHFVWGPIFSSVRPATGPTALVVSDGDDHDRRRRLVQPAFAKRRIDANAELILDELDRMLDTWTAGRSLDAHAEGRSAVRRIVVRSLFGPSLGDLADRLGEVFEPALSFVNQPPGFRVQVDLGVNAYHRCKRAVRAVDEIIQSEIDRRRRSGIDADAPDILTSLLTAAEGDAALTDAEIRDQVRSMIAAGYDTTSAALAWLVYGLGAHPNVQAALRDQVRDRLGDGRPDLDALRSLPLVDGVVRETLRLWPPASVSGRAVDSPVDLLGHRVDHGRWVMYSPRVTHRMPELWGDPLTYRPERWADGEPAPYAFVPFGAGRRNCIGFALATLELQLAAVRLVQRTRWTVEGPEPVSSAVASYAPTGGMPITLDR